MTDDDPTTEQVATVELASLRRIETAAKELLDQMKGRRSVTTVLSAVAALRAALKEAPPPEVT